MAIRLSKVLGGSAQSWLNMQTNYDFNHAEKGSKLSQLKKLDFERLTE
jgi:antitoxin HigA-1